MPDKYTLRPTGLGSKDDFELRFNGRDVGRTYVEKTPQGPRWHWSIYGLNLRGPLPQGVVVQGLADDLPAAKRHLRQIGKATWHGRRAAAVKKPPTSQSKNRGKNIPTNSLHVSTSFRASMAWTVRRQANQFFCYCGSVMTRPLAVRCGKWPGSVTANPGCARITSQP